MKAAVEKYGAKMIVVDPRRMELCRFRRAVAAAQAGHQRAGLQRHGACDHQGRAGKPAISSSQRTEGYADFADSVEKFTPEYAEMVSGVDRELIVQAARMYASAERGAIYWGMGISQLSHGTASALSLIHLAFLTGHIGRQGTGLNPLRGQNNVQGTSDMGAMPYHYPGYMLVDDPQNAGHWEAAWNIEPGGLNQKRGSDHHRDPVATPTRAGCAALYIMGENPMMTEPNLNQTRQHMQQLEFLVAQDLFINEFGAFADVFLPATSWAEKEGTFTNTDRRVQRVRQASPPRGQARPDWQIICDLAKRIEARLGRPDSADWDYSHPAEILAEIGGCRPGIRRGQVRAHRKGRPASAGVGRGAPRHALPVRRELPQRQGQVPPAGVRARWSSCRTTNTRSS